VSENGAVDLLLGGEAAALAASPPFGVPWDRLASVDGWAVWLGHPPVPDGLTPPPVPPSLLWDDPATAIAVAAEIACRYALRRGAAAPPEAKTLLGRESPIAVVVSDEVHPSLDAPLAMVAALGVPVLEGEPDPPAALAALAPFAARRAGHAVGLGRPHDPALAAQSVSPVDTMGGNPLSSFVLHAEAERDGISVVGEPSSRLGVEVGVTAPGVGIAETAALEAAASEMPAFLDGVSCRIEGHSLAIGWDERGRPSPEAIGGALRAWLKALRGMEAVDVRIAFAPPQGRSALLVDMRARAAAYRELRDELRRGDRPPPSSLPRL